MHNVIENGGAAGVGVVSMVPDVRTKGGVSDCPPVAQPAIAHQQPVILTPYTRSALVRPCQHNCWDNLRVRDHVITL
eukprot:gene18989-909_t